MLPNFLIIGTQKAGTTSLYRYLQEHPEVYMSPDKEPRYFTRCGDGVTRFSPYQTLEEYESLFSGVTDEKAIGEASVLYMLNPSAPKLIAEQIPDAKLIVVLRNPVDRVYSQYLFNVRDGRESRQVFRDVVEEELKLLEINRRDGQYLRRGFYGEQLERYLKHFSRDQIRIYTFEELTQDPDSMLEDLFRYLGVDDSVKVNTGKKYNVSNVPKNRMARAVLGWVSRRANTVQTMRRFMPDFVYWKMLVPSGRFVSRIMRSGPAQEQPQLDAETREILCNLYRDDLEQLHTLTGFDVSRWVGSQQSVT